MLVLSRKVGQEIVIGDNVRITITKVSGNRVTLGVDAPNDVRILRGELEPIARSFEEDQEPIRESVLRQTVALMDEVASNTIPFAPNAAR
jgi:carbon storage regulator